MKIEAKSRLLSWSPLAEAANLYQKAHDMIRSWGSASNPKKHGSQLVKEAKQVLDMLTMAIEGYKVGKSKLNVQNCERLLKYVTQVAHGSGSLPVEATQMETPVYSLSTEGESLDDELERKLDDQILDAASRLLYDHKAPHGFFPS